MSGTPYDIDAVAFYTRPIPHVCIIGAYFAFTGSFKFGFKDDVIRATEAAGGRLGRGIVDYLVVGEKLKKNQTLPFMSNQVKESLDMNEMFGTKIAIVPEFAWFAGVQSPTQIQREDGTEFPGDEIETWSGLRRIRFAYMDRERKYAGDQLNFRMVTIRTNAIRQEIYFEGYKDDNKFSGFLAHRIASDVTDLETGESHTPESFFRMLTGRPFKIEYCPPLPNDIE